MRRTERYRDHEEQLRAAQDGLRVALWTSGPGIIQSFVADSSGDIHASVALQFKIPILADDGSVSGYADIPLLPHVPVCFPHGGGVSMTFPLAQDDECWVIFGARQIDGWWQSGAAQPPSDFRSHDLSDAVCLPGPWSKPRGSRVKSVSTATAQFRTDDGQTYVEVNPQAPSVNVITSGTVRVQAQGAIAVSSGAGITVDAASTVEIHGPSGIVLNGNVTVNGSVKVSGSVAADGDVTGEGTSLHTHTHVNGGGKGNSGPPA